VNGKTGMLQYICYILSAQSKLREIEGRRATGLKIGRTLVVVCDVQVL